jgi:hypothetical protein
MPNYTRSPRPVEGLQSLERGCSHRPVRLSDASSISHNSKMPICYHTGVTEFWGASFSSSGQLWYISSWKIGSRASFEKQYSPTSLNLREERYDWWHGVAPSQTRNCASSLEVTPSYGPQQREEKEWMWHSVAITLSETGNSVKFSGNSLKMQGKKIKFKGTKAPKKLQKPESDEIRKYLRCFPYFCLPNYGKHK